MKIMLNFGQTETKTEKIETEFVGPNIFALKFGFHFSKTEDRDRKFRSDRMPTPTQEDEAGECAVLWSGGGVA